MITDIRDANFDRNDRNLFIVEDCEIKSMNKEQKSIISNFFRFECSHNQEYCIVICQNTFVIYVLYFHVMIYNIYIQ